MINLKKGLLICLLVVFLLAGCADGSIVTHATAVDWVWGTEELQSGAVRLWLRHDDIVGYCTNDPALISDAKESVGAKVEITFETIRWNDDTGGYSGCNRLYLGSESSTPIFKLTNITILSREDGQ